MRSTLAVLEEMQEPPLLGQKLCRQYWTEEEEEDLA